MLPFTPDVFFALFEQYNRAIWPVQIAAYAIGLAIVILVLKPIPGGGRLISAGLATLWAWTGIAYHWFFFAQINFVAPLFALLFVLQALLLTWTGVIRGRLTFRWTNDLYGWAGLGAALFAGLAYPLLGWYLEHSWPRAAMFGVAPCPTTIFTLGLLLLIAGRTPLHLVVLPVIWALIGVSAAFLLGVPEDFALGMAGLGGLILILIKNRRAKHP